MGATNFPPEPVAIVIGMFIGSETAGEENDELRIPGHEIGSRKIRAAFRRRTVSIASLKITISVAGTLRVVFPGSLKTK